MGGAICPSPEMETLEATGEPTDYYKTIGEYEYDIVEKGGKRKPRNPTGMPKLVLRFR